MVRKCTGESCASQLRMICSWATAATSSAGER